MYIRLASRFHAGIQGVRAPSAETAAAGRERAVRRIERLRVVLERASPMRGSVRSGAGSLALRRSAETTVTEHVFPTLSATLRRVPDAELVRFLDAIDSFSVLTRPLYVGQTTQQTIRSRYQQHVADYELGRSGSTFGGRLRGAGLMWSDLRLACYTTGGEFQGSGIERILESALHGMVHPFFSLR